MDEESLFRNALLICPLLGLFSFSALVYYRRDVRHIKTKQRAGHPFRRLLRTCSTVRTLRALRTTCVLSTLFLSHTRRVMSVVIRYYCVPLYILLLFNIVSCVCLQWHSMYKGSLLSS